jgi:hypothetical protein|nr:hypothetical protein [Kiritimatiellia bacterium]
VQRGGVELSERRRKAELSRVVNWPAAMAVEGIRHSIRFGYREIWPASVRGIPAKEQVWMRKEAARKLRAAVRRMEGCPKGGKLEDQYLQIMEVLHAES